MKVNLGHDTAVKPFMMRLQVIGLLCWRYGTCAIPPEQ